jgi:hypothetical protein
MIMSLKNIKQKQLLKRQPSCAILVIVAWMCILLSAFSEAARSETSNAVASITKYAKNGNTFGNKNKIERFKQMLFSGKSSSLRGLQSCDRCGYPVKENPYCFSGTKDLSMFGTYYKTYSIVSDECVYGCCAGRDSECCTSPSEPEPTPSYPEPTPLYPRPTPSFFDPSPWDNDNNDPSPWDNDPSPWDNDPSPWDNDPSPWDNDPTPSIYDPTSGNDDETPIPSISLSPEGPTFINRTNTSNIVGTKLNSTTNTDKTKVSNAEHGSTHHNKWLDMIMISGPILLYSPLWLTFL